MTCDRLIGLHDNRERPPSEELLRQLRTTPIHGAASVEYRTTALLGDVATLLPNTPCDLVPDPTSRGQR